MSRKVATVLTAVLAATVVAVPVAWAWGSMGHRLVGLEAMRALPAEVPAFLRSADAATEVGELAREPDRWKGAGKLHDADREGAHFVNLDDGNNVFEGPSLDGLPPTREAYEHQLIGMGKQDINTVGWLPYSIMDTWQQVVKDLAYWRVDVAAAKSAPDKAHRAWFKRDRVRREALILRDIGELAHYVGDGGQPLHVTVHYNGWGAFPNPDGFTMAHIHAGFEGAFVHANLTPEMVRSKVAAYTPCAKGEMEACVAEYLKASRAQVVPLYTLEKAGAFKDGDARGKAFVAGRLGACATELRDLLVDAWRASDDMTVGWPLVAPRDVESGKVADPFDALYGKD